MHIKDTPRWTQPRQTSPQATNRLFQSRRGLDAATSTLRSSIFHSTHSVLLCLVSLARRFSAAFEKVLDRLLTVGFSITNPLTLLSNASLQLRLHIPQSPFKISSLTTAAQKMALPSMPLPFPGYKGHYYYSCSQTVLPETYCTRNLALRQPLRLSYGPPPLSIPQNRTKKYLLISHPICCPPNPSLRQDSLIITV